MKFKGIIFDFNGVLLWDTHLHVSCWKQFSKEIRGVALSDDEIGVHALGRTNRYTLEYLVGHSLDEDQLYQLDEQKETIYRQKCLELGNNFSLSPGATQLLQFLIDQQIPHTIATASGKNNVDFFIEHLDLGRWFETDQIAFDDGHIAGKPAPDLYLLAASKLVLDPFCCVVIEDSLSGIQAAHAAGMGQIIALGASEKHPMLAGLEGVDAVITSLDQIDAKGLFL